MQRKVVLAIATAVIVVLASLTAFLFLILRNENPVIAETVSLEPMSWEGERPPPSIGVANYYQTMNHYLLYGGSINATAEMKFFLESSFWLDLIVTVDLTQGYVYNINVTTQNSTRTSQMMPSSQGFNEVENLTLLPDNSSSFMSFNGVNHPSRTTLRVVPRWVITSPDDQTEQATLTVAIMYFNGTAYRKAVCPFSLISTGCTNTNVGNAEEIRVGEKLANRVLSAVYRREEYFKIHLNEGEGVNVTMIPPFGANLDLYVYNSSDLIDPSYSSSDPEVRPKNIVFTVNATSWWFVKVSAGGEGAYTLEVVDL